MSMTKITQALVSASDHPDGFYYRVTVETATEGLCRLNVECCPLESDEAETSHGMVLTSAECKALGQMLLGVAAVLDADAS